MRGGLDRLQVEGGLATASTAARITGRCSGSAPASTAFTATRSTVARPSRGAQHRDRRRRPARRVPASIAPRAPAWRESRAARRPSPAPSARPGTRARSSGARCARAPRPRRPRRRAARGHGADERGRHLRRPLRPPCRATRSSAMPPIGCGTVTMPSRGSPLARASARASGRNSSVPRTTVAIPRPSSSAASWILHDVHDPQSAEAVRTAPQWRRHLVEHGARGADRGAGLAPRAHLARAELGRERAGHAFQQDAGVGLGVVEDADDRALQRGRARRRACAWRRRTSRPGRGSPWPASYRGPRARVVQSSAGMPTPDSLARHAATRYVQPLREGGSLPAVVDTAAGGLFVVKFRGAGQGAEGPDRRAGGGPARAGPRPAGARARDRGPVRGLRPERARSRDPGHPAGQPRRQRGAALPRRGVQFRRHRGGRADLGRLRHAARVARRARHQSGPEPPQSRTCSCGGAPRGSSTTAARSTRITTGRRWTRRARGPRSRASATTCCSTGPATCGAMDAALAGALSPEVIAARPRPGARRAPRPTR